MELRWLEVFCHVYSRRSFSEAARDLGLSQSTVSEHVRSLEAELQVELLDRAGKRVRPTAAGTALYEYGRQILTLKQDADRAMRRLVDRLEGELHLGASTIPGEYLLPGLIANFLRDFPGAQISMDISDSMDAIEGVTNGRIELGFVGARGSRRQLRFEPFATDALALVGPVDNPAGLPDRLQISQLAGVPLVVRESGSGTQRALENRLRELGADMKAFRIVLRTGSAMGVKEAVRAGVGYAFLSNRLLNGDEDGRALKRFQVAELVDYRRSFYMVQHVRRPRSPLADAFMEHVRRSVASNES